MPQILFIDDEPYNLSMVVELLPGIIPDCTVHITENASTSIEWLTNNQPDIIIMDIFLPLGANPQHRLGSRAHQFEENIRHLGGLAILDYVEKMTSRPLVFTHTACTDFSLPTKSLTIILGNTTISLSGNTGWIILSTLAMLYPNFEFWYI